MATSKVAVIPFPAQTSIAPPIVSAERACGYAECSPLVRWFGATPNGLRPNFLTQDEAGSQQKEPLPRPLTFVEAGAEQSQPVITSTLISVHPQSSTHEALMTRIEKEEERNRMSSPGTAEPKRLRERFTTEVELEDTMLTTKSSVLCRRNWKLARQKWGLERNHPLLATLTSL